jgi:chromosome segregation ATPase
MSKDFYAGRLIVVLDEMARLLSDKRAAHNDLFNAATELSSLRHDVSELKRKLKESEDLANDYHQRDRAMVGVIEDLERENRKLKAARKPKRKVKP